MNERSIMASGLAYVFSGAGRIAAQQRTLPEAGPGESLVEVIGCGLCHTDLGYFNGSVPTKKPVPLVLGHEVVGRAAGKTVRIPAVIPCGKCAFCAAGRGNACPEQQMPGNDIDGGFATHQIVRTSALIPVPESADVWKYAVVADAVSTAYQAVKRSGLAAGDVAV